jgi:KDO2-lipid IV(A) lauroyltransferase
MAAPPPRNQVWARIAALQRSRIKGKLLSFDANIWRRAVQHLERPGAILMAAVDELAADRVATPSFGRTLEPRSNLGKLVRIASRTGAIVLPMYSERLPGARFVTRVLTPVEIPRTPKISPETHAHLVARIDALYGPVVLRLIEQWFGLLLWR